MSKSRWSFLKYLNPWRTPLTGLVFHSALVLIAVIGGGWEAAAANAIAAGIWAINVRTERRLTKLRRSPHVIDLTSAMRDVHCRPVYRLRSKRSGAEVYTTNPEFYLADGNWEEVRRG